MADERDEERKMHRRAQRAEADLAAATERLLAAEADNRRLRLELGLALADRHRAEYERDQARQGRPCPHCGEWA